MQLADAHPPSLALSKSGTKPMNIGGISRRLVLLFDASVLVEPDPASADVLRAEEVVVAGVPEHQHAVRPAPVRAAVRAQQLEHLVAVHGGQRQPRRHAVGDVGAPGPHGVVVVVLAESVAEQLHVDVGQVISSPTSCSLLTTMTRCTPWGAKGSRGGGTGSGRRNCACEMERVACFEVASAGTRTELPR
jgi:hypothetical protein